MVCNGICSGNHYNFLWWFLLIFSAGIGGFIAGKVESGFDLLLYLYAVGRFIAFILLLMDILHVIWFYRAYCSMHKSLIWINFTALGPYLLFVSVFPLRSPSIPSISGSDSCAQSTTSEPWIIFYRPSTISLFKKKLKNHHGDLSPLVGI